MKIIFLSLFSYILGCLSPSHYIGKRFMNIDIREHGSGNAGATNAMRVMGKKVGALTLLLDLLKGALAVWIGRYFLGEIGSLIGALFVVLGHDFPVLLKFKGGKGVATSIGVLLTIVPYVGLIAVITGVLIVIFTRYVSLASVTVAVLSPIMVYLQYREFNSTFFVIFFLASLLIFKHRENIKRLINKTESKLGSK